MSFFPPWSWLWTLLLAAWVACGGESVQPPDLGPLLVEVTYQGSNAGLPLTELKLHDIMDDYASAPNRLSAPLAIGQTVTFDGNDISGGMYYVTVVRKLYDLPESDLVALTSAESISLYSGKVVIWVLDEGFRFFDPVDSRTE